MEIKTLILLVLVCAIGVSGCADKSPVEKLAPEDAGADNVADTMESIPAAADLFSVFANESSYKDWSIWPGKEAMMGGNGVHGDYVSIYVSNNAFSAAEVGGGPMPYETMVVKEGFNADKELTGIYLMYKLEGFDSDNNDWFWASYSADGTVKSEGKVGGCINCHEGKKDVDYIFVNA
ncbi:cytochrome P460 family protein [Methanolobus sp.]|jgi:hypothetical protein|uniref:cytochrome P460 family protein n=1 Tax=Methanolobus sp. TaxID=1874737 RepID=UPI0025E3B43A|nr:cytochrome P460 family protein [Methanolobus sp.]